MVTIDWFLQEALKHRPAAKRLRLTGPAVHLGDVGQFDVAEFPDPPQFDFEEVVKYFGLPIHKGPGYVATSQWDLATDRMTYYVVRAPLPAPAETPRP